MRSTSEAKFTWKSLKHSLSMQRGIRQGPQTWLVDTVFPLNKQLTHKLGSLSCGLCLLCNKIFRWYAKKHSLFSIQRGTLQPRHLCRVNFLQPDLVFTLLIRQFAHGLRLEEVSVAVIGVGRWCLVSNVTLLKSERK